MSGIIGVYSVTSNDVADDLLYSLVALQHRGEEGCGISVTKGGPGSGFLRPTPEKSLVYYHLRNGAGSAAQKLEPCAGIGHALYESSGALQPENRPGLTNQLTMAMDGVLPNVKKKSETDDGHMRALFQNYLEQSKSFGENAFFEAGERVMKDLWRKGSYCVVSLVDAFDEQYLVAYRDPRGIKPLAFGKKGNTYIVSSETKAIRAIDAEVLGDVKPGEMIVVSRKGVTRKTLAEDEHAHCAFEWIYFADPTSTIEGRNVYEMRKAMGSAIVERYSPDADIVIASPDSGRGVAIGFHQALCKRGKFVPFEEAIIKNPGAKRTFQVENDHERRIATRTKFYINEEIVKGKRVVCGDDSIVRGTVFKDGIVVKLHNAGACQVSAVISCPPLKYACMKDPMGKTFIAQGMEGSVEEIGKQVATRLELDAVYYPTINDVRVAIGMNDLCLACFDGKYPTETSITQTR